MSKLLLISVVVATLVLPARAARHPAPAIALRRALAWVAAYYAFYVVALLYVLPRLG